MTPTPRPDDPAEATDAVRGAAPRPAPSRRPPRPAAGARRSGRPARASRIGATRVVARLRPAAHRRTCSWRSSRSLTLAADIGTKTWAEQHLDGYPGIVEVWKNHLTLILAKNRGGAWGLLQSTSENVRRPFFLLVSVAAIAFIMTLYRRLQPRQRALKWGLPLVLGGALGNVFDRIRYGHVIDFIDVHIALQGRDHHWPTFNVADVAICVGVGLMAVDMFTCKRGARRAARRRIPRAVRRASADWHGAVHVGEPAAAGPHRDPGVADASGDAPPAEAPPTE